MSRAPEPIFPALFTQAETREPVRQFDRDLVSMLGKWALELKNILDRGLSVADNWDAVVVSYTSNGVANTEDTVSHSLGRVPSYYIVVSIDKGAVIYKSGTAFTRTNVYLKSTVASTAVTLILL